MVHRILVLAVVVVLILVPVAGAETDRGQHGSRTHDKSSAAPHHEPVNINTADVKSLMTLDGVGHKVAEKIVEYRDAHGPFKKAEDVRKVEGIGGGLWERNRERIVVK